MTKTISITVNRELYRLLKRVAGRRMSRFISEILRDKLQSRRKALSREYISASKDRARLDVLRDWNGVERQRD